MQLTLTGRNQLLDNGSNLLLVKNVADWAESTDLSDTNKITSQEFKFDYEKPEVEVGIELKKESAEQYIITLVVVPSNVAVPSSSSSSSIW